MTAKELIEKYLRQGLTKDERFDLEKKALDDELLANAWEGYQLYQQGDKHEVIPTLENRLAQAVKQDNKGKVVSFRKYWPMVAAASVALLLGATFFFNRTSSDFTGDKADTMAVVLEEEMEVVETDDVISEAKGMTLNAPQSAAIESRPKPTDITKREDIVSGEIEDAQDIQKALKDKVRERASEVLVGSDHGANAVAASDILPATSKINEDRSETQEILSPPSEAEVMIVMDDNTKKKTNIQALSLDTDTGQATKESEILTTKLRSKKLDLDSREEGSLATSTKVPTYAKRIKISSETPDTSKASPSMGWAAFQQYVDDNARFERDVLFMRGYINLEVLTFPLVFDLDEYNKPTNIKIRGKQNFDEFDREVIRVLQGSGTWSTLQPGKPISINLKVTLRPKE